MDPSEAARASSTAPPSRSSKVKRGLEYVAGKPVNWGIKMQVRNATKDIKREPGVISRLPAKVLEGLPEETLNDDIPPANLHELPENVLVKVSPGRIKMMPNLATLAKQSPGKLAVVLTRAPDLVDDLEDGAIAHLRKLEPVRFYKLPEKVQVRFRTVLPDVFVRNTPASERDQGPPLPPLPHQTSTGDPNYPNGPGTDPTPRVRSQPVQPLPTESSPYIPPLSVSHGSSGTLNFAQDTFSAVQGAMHSMPSVMPVPRTSSFPQTNHSQTNQYEQFHGSHSPSSGPVRNSFSSPDPYSSSHTYTPPYTLGSTSTSTSTYNSTPSYGASSSYSAVTHSGFSGYETSTPQPHASHPGQPTGSPSSQPGGPSRSSSPLGYRSSTSTAYDNLPNSWSPANGPQPPQHSDFKLFGTPGQAPNLQSFQVRQRLQILDAQGQIVEQPPPPNAESQPSQVLQDGQNQFKPTRSQPLDVEVRELDSKVDNWSREKTALEQQLANLTAKLTSEKEQLMSEREKTDTLNKSIGRLEGDKERLEKEKQTLVLEKHQLATEKAVLENEKEQLKEKQKRVDASITSYLHAKKWKGLKKSVSKSAIDMLFDFCNDQVGLATEHHGNLKEQKEISDKLELEKEQLAQNLRDQEELIADRDEWRRKFTDLDLRFNRINDEHRQLLEAERRQHQQQLEAERRRLQQQFEAQSNQYQTESRKLQKRIEGHQADQHAATEKVRAMLQAEIDTLQQEQTRMQAQYQSYKDGYEENLRRLTEEHEITLNQLNLSHDQKMQALHAQCQELINQVGIQFELNKQQAVKDLENKVRLLESSLVDNSDDYRPATDDHLQVDFDQLNLDITKITHNLPAVDFYQVRDPGGFLDREGRDQLRFLLQSIFWEHMMYGFFSSPYGLGALGPEDGKQRLLEVWIAYRKLLGAEKSDVRLPNGKYDMGAIEQDYVEFLRNDKETNKWRSSTFQAVMAALLPKKDKAHSPLTDYLSSPFFRNRNNVRENILTELRRICVGGIPQAIEQTVENMVFKASELALQFGMQRSELGLIFPQRNTLVRIGPEFVICYDNDAEHGMQKPVFLSVSPMCYKRGDGRNDTTSTKFISPGHIYPHAQ
ncbi:hypothetical protein QBC41DRAFT_327906 [Cercophora samala]|uniref:Uncharacterized protein n=1 Tax=Cercophora samala TaxID=330535 RepID=A0AA39Z763_9PEZI|nr:hypothetical protein QBC41DRAFT_327906 [Cercophora samala]